MRCSRQFKFKKFDKIDKTVGFLRALVKLFDIQSFQGFLYLEDDRRRSPEDFAR